MTVGDTINSTACCGRPRSSRGQPRSWSSPSDTSRNRRPRCTAWVSLNTSAEPITWTSSVTSWPRTLARSRSSRTPPRPRSRRRPTAGEPSVHQRAKRFAWSDGTRLTGLHTRHGGRFHSRRAQGWRSHCRSACVPAGAGALVPESLVGTSSIPSRARPARTSSSRRRYLA